jgi:hypothetical protein
LIVFEFQKAPKPSRHGWQEAPAEKETPSDYLTNFQFSNLDISRALGHSGFASSSKYLISSYKTSLNRL